VGLFRGTWGAPRYLHFQAAPIRNDRGEIIAVIETLEDITREQEMAQNLREYAESLQSELSENIRLRTEIEGVYRYLQSILDSSPDMLIELNKDGYITFMSRGQIEGLGDEKLVGKHFTQFIPVLTDELLARWEELKRGNYHPYEIEVLTAAGERSPFSPRPVPLPSGSVTYLSCGILQNLKNLSGNTTKRKSWRPLGSCLRGSPTKYGTPFLPLR